MMSSYKFLCLFCHHNMMLWLFCLLVIYAMIHVDLVILDDVGLMLYMALY